MIMIMIMTMIMNNYTEFGLWGLGFNPLSV